MKRTLVKIAHPIRRAYWFLFRPKTYGVKCVVQNNGRVLFVRNTYGGGTWTFPGGGVKKGETPEDAVRREVFEEVGVVVTNLKKVGQFINTKEYKRDTVAVFAAECENDHISLDPTEIAEARWFARHEPPLISDNALAVITMVN